ncbi:MAG: heparinase, partial [Gammaproteobacteria bacterium]
YKSAQARFHFHPRIAVSLRGSRLGSLGAADGPLRYVVSTGRARLEDTTYHPEFGCSIPNKCLVVELEQGESVVAFDFSA